MKKRKKNERSGGAGGLLMGMRGGFKKAAKSVTGQDEKQKKGGVMDWILTLATVLLAAYVIYKFFLR